jgi:hypothetical protein
LEQADPATGGPITTFGEWDSNDGPGITNPGELDALKA